MSKLLQLAGLEPTFASLEMSIGWDWQNRALGYCTDFVDLGMSALVLGPIHIQFAWFI